MQNCSARVSRGSSSATPISCSARSPSAHAHPPVHFPQDLSYDKSTDCYYLREEFRFTDNEKCSKILCDEETQATRLGGITGEVYTSIEISGSSDAPAIKSRWRNFNFDTPEFELLLYMNNVLTYYLKQSLEPPWTSYFVRYADVQNDQRGMSHFNWAVGSSNYHVLRTGCFPYIKYHCSKRPKQDLSFDDTFFKAIKIINLGIPTLIYGLAATQLIRHSEVVKTPNGDVTIFFLLPEDKGSEH